MKFISKKIVIAIVALFGLAETVAAVSTPAQAASPYMLAGKWSAALGGNTGCGITSMFVTFTLNGSGVGAATILQHSTGCANTTIAGTFTVLTVDNNGQGTASLSCGASCGWSFKIQVASSGDAFILADVDAANPNNTPTGTALRMFP